MVTSVVPAKNSNIGSSSRSINTFEDSDILDADDTTKLSASSASTLGSTLQQRNLTPIEKSFQEIHAISGISIINKHRST